MSFFEGIPEAPPDAIFGLSAAFNEDKSPNKLNLVVGAYRTEEGKPYVLNSVKKAEQKMLNSPEFNKEYLPIDGLTEFNKLSAQLLFGKDLVSSLGKKLVTVQGLSGTGSLRLGADFIKKFMPNSTVYISEPTWANHKNIFNAAGVPWKSYRYYNLKTNTLDFDGLTEDLRNAAPGSVILLHACAHNPTGLDPTDDQWDAIASLIQECKLFAYFDCAYQGFASGDLNRDAAAVRKIVQRGMEMFCTQSYAKNCGLYAERIGAINIVCSSEKGATSVRSQFKALARANYSNPPTHGATIVSLILSTPELYDEWRVELKGMADRIHQMRNMLYEALKQKGVDWPHVLKQIGMFSYSGLTAKQVELLKVKHHVYMTSDGRISLAGLSAKAIPQLTDAIVDVLKESKL